MAHFWNPGDTPTRILELITPGGLENLFRKLGNEQLDPQTLPAIAADAGCELDFEATAAVIENHGLRL